MQDYIYQSKKKEFEDMKCQLEKFDKEIQKFHDYQLHANRRPKVLVQTAGHVSGAVRFYQESDADPTLVEGKLFPVCMHPKYGGWMALRGIFVFPNISVPK